MKKYDVAIIGAGILGVTIAYWLSVLFDCSIVLIDKEARPAFHTSSRNTGVVHRPFYLDPVKKKIFAKAAQKSYFLWKDLASKYGLPWKQLGTLEVAIEERDLGALEKYAKWATNNGMEESEFQVLGSEDVRKIEPEVRASGAFFSKTDSAVEYGSFTNCIFEIASKNGVRFMNNCEVKGAIESKDAVKLKVRKNDNTKGIEEIECGTLINAAGGGSLDIAHMMGYAFEYTDLHFRGEYYSVLEPYASRISRNIYSVPKHREFPFLDPHFIVRANRKKEIGPNAVLVATPGTYHGLSESKSELVKKILERPNSPKIKLFTSAEFLSLVADEWKSSLSKKAMCDRVRQFLPSLSQDAVGAKGLAGVRSSLIDSDGFVPEAIQIAGSKSIHVLNYNSPGATGAPAYSAYVVARAWKEGMLEGFRRRKAGELEAYSLWDYFEASELV